MKAKSIVFVALLGLILSSCLVKSIHPFYKESDLYFDKNLIGTWMDKDSSKWYVKQIYVSYGEGENKKEYRNNGYVVGHKSKKGDVTHSYDIFLFKINNQLYADFSTSLAYTFTLNDDYNNKVNTHNLAKVNINNNEISFTFFNGVWLAELIEKNKIRIAHEFVEYPEPVSLKYKGEYVLTASTDELQKFIAKYGDDPKAFASNPRKLLDDGTYQWNAGEGEITGKMVFTDHYEASIKLKKINEK
jgi:hypothetical protein